MAVKLLSSYLIGTYDSYETQCWIILASFPVHVGGARKWPENEAIAMLGCICGTF